MAMFSRPSQARSRASRITILSPQRMHSPGAAATATVTGSPYPITAVLNAPAGVLANYNVITINTGKLTVTQRPLVVTPDDKAKVFGTVFTAFTGTITGIQNNDDITPVYASTGAPADAPSGTYPITVTLNDPDNKLPNYNVTLNTGTLTVGTSVLTVTADDQTIVYGDPDPSLHLYICRVRCRRYACGSRYTTLMPGCCST